MKYTKFPLLLFLLAACHRPAPPAKEIAFAVDEPDTTHYPLANDDTESDLRVFDNFRDSVAEEMELTHIQIKKYLDEDTAYGDIHYLGRQVKTFGKLYVMIFDFQYGSYKLYTIDTVTNRKIDDVILGFNTDSDGDFGGSVCEYRFKNDSTIRVIQKEYDPEGNEPPIHVDSTTYTVSREGRITKKE